MKEIRTIKMVEQIDIKFVADDGKEFVGENAETRCINYERQKDIENVKAEFNRLNAIEIHLPIVEFFNYESEIWKIVLESKKDYFAMIDYFKVVKHCYIDDIVMPKEFPYTMFITKGYEDIWEYHNSLYDELKNALDLIGE